MRTVALILLVIGVLLFLVSLTADSTGIGEGMGIGWKQITGTIVGVIAAAIGVVLMRENR